MIESIELKNLTLNKTIHINMDFGEYWLESVQLGQVEGVFHSFKCLNQIGENLYSTSLEPRNLQVTGWAASEDPHQLKALKQALNKIINPKHAMELYVGSRKIRFYPRTSVVYSTNPAENNEIMSKFLISGYCPYPLFTDRETHVESVAHTEGKLKFPFVIPEQSGVIMGIRQPSLIAEVNNTGDLPVGYRVKFKATGTVVNPSLTDIETQQFIKLNKTLSAGEEILVDTREDYRQVIGSLEGVSQNYFSYRTLDSSWLTLQQGVNHLRYNAEKGVSYLEVYLEFAPGYLEVET